MINFKKFFEGIRTEDDEFVLDFKTDLPDDFVNLTYASKKVLRSSILQSLPTFYAYSLNSNFDNNDKSTREKLIQLFKNKKEITEDNYDKLLNKAIIRFDNISPIQNYDIIICPKGSSIGLKDLLKKFQERNTHAIISNEVLVKNVRKLIKVNYNLYKEKTKKENISQLEDNFNKAFDKDGLFSIKKIYMPFRKFINDFMFIKGQEHQRNIFNAICNGKVLIIDDVLSSGETIKDCINQVQKLAPKEINIFILYRNQKS